MSTIEESNSPESDSDRLNDRPAKRVKPVTPTKRRTTTATRKLTKRQQRFVELMASDATSATDAARRAGYGKSARHRASENLAGNGSKRNVVAALGDALARPIAVVDMSREAHVARMAELARAARGLGQISAAVRAEELVGKIAGLYVERSENINLNVELSRMSADSLNSLLVQVSARLQSLIEEQARPITIEANESNDLADTLE